MELIEELENAKLFFKLLTTEGRIRVANLLTQVEEINVSDIADICEIEQSMCSRYLGDLTKNRLVNIRRQSQMNYYSFKPEAKMVFSSVLNFIQDISEIKRDNALAQQGGH